jgi:hypothetical protein
MIIILQIIEKDIIFKKQEFNSRTVQPYAAAQTHASLLALY